MDTFYGEMYMYENSTPETVDTNAKYKAVRNFITGQCNGFVFNAGSTKAITAIANYNSTVPGTVLATSATHGLATNDIVSILGTTNYNGVYKITRVDANSFYFTATWGATETGTWYKGSSLQASVGSAGKYRACFGVSGDSAGSNKLYKVELNVNEVAADNISGDATFGTGVNYVEIFRQGILTIADGDFVWLSFKEVDSGTDNMTFINANVNLSRI
jgi:hypothetical protein